MAGSHSAATDSRIPKWVASWLSGLTVVLFGLGLYGHLQLGNHLDDAAYKSLQLFHLHYHPYPDEALPEGAVPAHAGPLPLALQVARFGAGFLALTLLPALVGFFYEDRIIRWWVRKRWSGHVVVWGHCSRTLSLIRDLRRERHKVVFIGHCPVPAAELPAGVCYLEARHADRSLLAKAALERASRLVALNENDRDNLEILVAAEHESAQRDTRLPPLECHAHFSDTHLKSGLYQTYVTAARGTTERTRQQLFNYYDVAARLLAHEYPMPETLAATAPTPEHIVIVGFGAFGQCVALKLVKMGQQLFKDGTGWKTVNPRITVIDPRGKAATEPFLRTHHQFTNYCTFSTVPLSCEDADFLDLSFLDAADATVKTSIVFCLENETLTLRSLLLLLEACRAGHRRVSRIYLRIGQPESLGPLIDTLRTAAAGPEVVFFAADREMFSADVLLNRSLDVLAKRVHESYLLVEAAARTDANQASAADKTWDELREEDRDSNREAADHMWAKLATLGYRLRVVPAGEPPPAVDSGLIRELESRVEEFARAEHFRWMTWRALTGWRYGTPRNNDLRLHPDMVDYDALPEATQDKDRIIIRSIPELLKEGRLRVERGKGAGRD